MVSHNGDQIVFLMHDPEAAGSRERPSCSPGTANGTTRARSPPPAAADAEHLGVGP